MFVFSVVFVFVCLCFVGEGVLEGFCVCVVFVLCCVVFCVFFFCDDVVKAK